MNKLTAPTIEDIAKKELCDRLIQQAKQRDEQFKEFVESGAHNKVARLISMAYLLFTIGQNYVEDSMNVLEKYGFMHKKLKTRAINLVNSFDVYNALINSLIKEGGSYDSEQAYDQLDKDIDILQDICNRFMNADVRIGHMDVINRDDLRKEGVYLCQVKDCLIAPVQCFKWNGEKWLEFVREPFPKWTETDQIITYVIDRVKTVEE